MTLRFGGVVALDEINFKLYEGEILGLIGPNGAGKTTCFNAMTGVYQPTSGADPVPTASRSPAASRTRSTELGIARTFQNIRLFPEMTALENVMVGADARHKTSVPGALFRLYRVAKPEELPGHCHAVVRTGSRSAAAQDVRAVPAHLEERAGERRLELLRFVGIADRADELARNLPYGDQRRLEIARALATEPEAALPGRAGRRLQPGGEGGTAHS